MDRRRPGAERRADAGQLLEHPPAGDEVGRSYHGFTGKTRGKPIDYIFTSRDLTLRQVELRREGNEGQFPSDHYPVVARVEL